MQLSSQVPLYNSNRNSPEITLSSTQKIRQKKKGHVELYAKK